MIDTTRATTAASSSPRIGWTGLALVAAGLAAIVLYKLRLLLFSNTDVLPGTDAGNLYAWELYTRSVLATGRLPHWNPYLFSGTPHLADTQTTVLYPPALLLRWLPPAAFLSWMAALHMIIGGTGAALLARVIGLRWAAAVAAAVALTLGGSVPAWIYNGHLLLLYATAWLPWIVAAMLLSFRRATVWPHPLLVLLLVVQFLAGYLQGTIYIGAVVAAVAVWSAAWPEMPAPRARWRPLIQIALAVVLAAGLAAFQLWPTLQLVSSAGRTAGLPYSDAIRGAWSAKDLASLLFPFEGVSAATPFRNLSDRTAYVGWLLVLLAPLAFIGRHRRTALLFGVLLVGTLALVLASTLPFYRLHFLLFPGLRVPGRLLFVATLSLAMLGAMTIDRLTAMLEVRRGRVPAVLVAVLLVALVGGDVSAYSRGAVQRSSPDPAPALFAIPPGPGRTRSVCDRALVAMDLLIGGRAAADGAGAVMLAGYSQFQELARQDGPLRMRRDLLDLVNVTSIVACEPLAGAGLSPIATANPGLVFHNASAWPRAVWTCQAERMTARDAVEHLREVQYDSNRRLVRRHFVNIRWAAAVDGQARLALEARYRLGDGVQGDGRTWRYDLQDRSADNIRRLLADTSVEDTHGIDRVTGDVAAADDVADQVVYGTAACAEAGEVTVLSADTPGGDVRVATDAPADGLLFLSEPYYPERVAFVDGAAVATVKANVAFTAIPVPAGRHVVDLRYVPRRFQQGLAASTLTMVGWVGLAVLLPRRHSSLLRQTDN